MRPMEAGESAASHGVPAEDRWTGEGGHVAADPEAIVEGGGSGTAPHETMEGSGSGAAPHEVSPPAPEQGAGSKRSHPDESGQGSGDPSPKRFRRSRASV